MKVAWWRKLLGVLPMPMLGLVASRGVYEFGLLYLPEEFALAGAAAFESVYIGLAVQKFRTTNQRNRARNISRGAVAVSILYVAVAAYFHRNPDALAAIPWYGEVLMALLHAIPLATLNYLVAQLLLHEDEDAPATTALAVAPQPAESRNVTRPTTQTTIRVIDVMRPKPASMRPQLAAPEVVADAGRWLVAPSRVDEWIARNDAGETYAAISRSMGGKPSRTYISNQCAARRAQLIRGAIDA